MSEKISYNEAVSRLETIVSELEKGGKSLDETLAMFEEGAALLKVCQHELDSAEGRLAELSLEEINSQIVAGAGALKSRVSEFAKNNEYANFEFLSSIPGTVGGGVSMNAGCFGSNMSDIVSQISVIDMSGEEKIITLKNIGFDYRKTELLNSYIIIEVLFKKTKKIQSSVIENKINLLKKKKKREAKARDLYLVEFRKRIDKTKNKKTKTK